MGFRDKDIQIIDSNVNDSVQVYYRAEINQSDIKENCIIGENSRIRSSILENYVSIDRNNLILASTVGAYTYTGPFDMIFKTSIGKFCSISYGVTIGPPEHDYSKLTTHPFIYDRKFNIFDSKELLEVYKVDKSCNIGNDVWIGCNVTILRGVRIGDGAVIGANSLVNKDVPPFAIVGGVPAKIIKYRFTHKQIEQIQNLEWWNWPIEEIRKNKDLFLNDKSIQNLK